MEENDYILDQIIQLMLRFQFEGYAHENFMEDILIPFFLYLFSKSFESQPTDKVFHEYS